ncbi:MAG: class I SAM-dependent methyltransferase [Limnohabitans sp.]|jgi:precorrin-6B methylase 2|nr:class I SAM-dependent methyltransferase [Limnohabitans sp.]
MTEPTRLLPQVLRGVTIGLTFVMLCACERAPSNATVAKSAVEAETPSDPRVQASVPEVSAAPILPSDAYGVCERGEGGSGKTYMGREIAEVMGHFGVGWLERPEREREERTDLLVSSMKLKPTDAVADIGAGSGYFTMRLAPLVPEGVVYATDIQKEMLDIVTERALEENAHNVMPVLGEIDHCGLEPNSVDVVLFVDAYHEFSHPWEMMTSIVRALKPGGRVYLVEYRLEDPTVAIKERHKMSEIQAQREMEAVGLQFVENVRALPQQHILVFERK